jgi:hypothetical protein
VHEPTVRSLEEAPEWRPEDPQTLTSSVERA